MSRLGAASARGDYEASRVALLEAVELAFAFDEMDVRVDQTQQAIDRVVQNHVEGKRIDETIALLEKVDSQAKRRGAEHHPVALHALERRGRLHLEEGQAQRAEAALRAFVEASEARSGSDPRRALEGQVRLAAAIAFQGRLDEASAMARAVADSAVLRADDPEVLEAELLLGGLELARGRVREALTILREAYAAGEEKGMPAFGTTIEAAILLGQAHLFDGDLNAADRAFEDADRALRRLNLAGADRYYARILGGQGAVAQARGDLLRAFPLQDRALALAESGFGDTHAETARAAIALASTYRVAGATERARSLIDRARSIVDEAEGMSLVDRTELQSALSAVAARIGENRAAIRHSREAARQAEKSYGSDLPETAVCRARYALALVEAGQARAATADADKAVAVLGRYFGHEHVVTAESLAILARVRAEAGRHSEALALFGQALAVLEAGYGARSPVLADVLEARERALRAAGSSDAAERDAVRLAALRAGYRSGASRVAPSGAVEVGEYNFRLQASPPWRAFDPARVGPRARAAFYRVNPQVTFAVVPQVATRGVEYSREWLQEAVQSSLEASNDAVELVSQRERTVDGIVGPEMLFRVISRALSYRMVIWAGAHGEWIYQLMTYSDDLSVTNEQLIGFAEEMFAGFSLTDRDAKAPEANLRFDSPRFGYSLDLEGRGWIPWETLEAEQPSAEFGALHPSGGAFVVIPVALLGTEPGDRIVQQALLSMINQQWPAAPRSIRVGDLRGIEADFTRTANGGVFRGRVRVLRNSDAAYVLLALANEELGDRSSKLLGIIDSVTWPSHGVVPISAAAFSPQENRRHALAFNEIGLAYERIGSRGEAIRFLERAHDLTPDNLVILQNLVQIQMESGRYAEALERLEGKWARFSEKVELLGYRALARDRTGDRAGALRDYEKAFELGMEDEDFLGHFAGLLWEVGERDRALALLDEAIAAHGSVGLRTTRASLRRRAGEYDASIEELEAIAALDAADVSVMSELILSYYESGRHHEAVEACERYESSFGRSADLLVQRARSEYALGLYREAMSSVDGALKLEPGSSLAKDFKSLLAATLGEGDVSLLRQALEPVAFPPELVEGAELDEKSVADWGAGYVHWVEALRYEAGGERRRTIYLRGAIANSRGADELSTLRFGFDPVWERIWVNELVVRDASGAVVARKDAANLYVLDDAGEDGIHSSSKVLDVAIPGLGPGATFEAVVTRQDLQPPDRFQLVDHRFSAGVPVAVSALFLSGDLDHLTEWTSSGVIRRQIGDGIAWVAENPTPARWEPMQDTSLAHLPRVLLGDDRDSWEDLGRAYAEELAAFVEPDPVVPAVVEAEGSPRQRASKAARYVQDLLTYKALIFGVRARIPNAPGVILGNRFGDCKDHSILLLQLLKRAGLEPRLALVSLSEPIELSVPSLDQFDHMVVYCEACGESGFLDTTDKDLHPAAGVPRGLAGRYALVLDPDHPELMRIAEYSSERHTVSIDRRVMISRQGSLSVVEEAVLAGHWGASVRGALRAVERSRWKETLQRYLFNERRGLVLNEVAVDDVDELTHPLELRLEYEAPGWFSASESRLIGRVPSLLEAAYLQATPIDSRSSPFEIHYPLHVRSTARFELPAGFTSNGASRTLKSPSGAKYLVFEGSIEPQPGGVAVSFVATRLPGRYPASEYARYYQEAQRAAAFFDSIVEFTRR